MQPEWTNVEQPARTTFQKLQHIDAQQRDVDVANIARATDLELVTIAC